MPSIVPLVPCFPCLLSLLRSPSPTAYASPSSTTPTLTIFMTRRCLKTARCRLAPLPPPFPLIAQHLLSRVLTHTGSRPLALKNYFRTHQLGPSEPRLLTISPHIKARIGAQCKVAAPTDDVGPRSLIFCLTGLRLTCSKGLLMEKLPLLSANGDATGPTSSATGRKKANGQ